MIKKKITIIDYGAGNIRSIERAINKIGYSTIVTNDNQDIKKADSLILPGVGAFSKAMEKLYELDLIDAIHSYCKSGKPFLGICLGMQLLCSKSFEFGETIGLDVVSGYVKNITTKKEFTANIKIPVIGWYKVENIKKSLASINGDNRLFYHIHSFYCDLDEKKYELFTSNINGLNICTGLNKDNIFGFQFHPEKSRSQGLELLNQFCDINY
jgi:glutamine amidotransferase